jgi:gliding motility-associated lipoprotein GldH
MQFLRLIIGIVVIVTLQGCASNVVFEQNNPVNCHGWKMTDTLLYEVTVEDIQQKYDLSINIRHRDVYEFMNVYLNIETQMPNNRIKKEVISVPLCDDGGKWYGNCSGDICFQRVFLMKKLIFPATGKYVFRINQEMRTEELPNILDVGVRLEKSIKKVMKEDV